MAAQSLEPKVSRAELSEFLIKPAEKAIKDRDYALAVSLWRGVAAIRGDGDDSMLRLAKVWEMQGEFDAAADELDRYADAVTDATKKTDALTESAALRVRERGFSGKEFQPKPATTEAGTAFKNGGKYFAKKAYAEAILLYKAGLVMAPDLAGNLRQLGQSYDALGRKTEANEFFVRYLRIRPFSNKKNQKDGLAIRDRLAKEGIVGKLTIETSFTCDVVMVNRQDFEGKLPAKDIVVAPGRYKALCVNDKYHLAFYQKVDVRQGQSAKISFNWAVLRNKLEPWGRMTLEAPNDPRAMMDVGIETFDEVGIPVPDDRRSLKYKLVAGDGSKTKDNVTIKLEPGKTIDIAW